MSLLSSEDTSRNGSAHQLVFVINESTYQPQTTFREKLTLSCSLRTSLGFFLVTGDVPRIVNFPSCLYFIGGYRRTILQRILKRSNIPSKFEIRAFSMHVLVRQRFFITLPVSIASRLLIRSLPFFAISNHHFRPFIVLTEGFQPFKRLNAIAFWIKWCERGAANGLHHVVLVIELMVCVSGKTVNHSDTYCNFYRINDKV